MEGEGSDEFGGGLGHHAVNFVAFFDQLGGEVGGLVGGDGAGDAKYDIHSRLVRLTFGVETLGEEKMLEEGVVAFAVGGEEAVRILGPVGDFFAGIFEAEGDDVFGVGAAATEAVLEFFVGGGHHEEVDEGELDVLVGMGADLLGALDVDVHDDVFARFEEGEDFGQEGAVVIAVDFGMLEEGLVLDFGLEIRDWERK